MLARYTQGQSRTGPCRGCWYKGYVAGRNGKARADCPYYYGGTAGAVRGTYSAGFRAAWQAGYAAGKADREDHERLRGMRRV